VHIRVYENCSHRDSTSLKELYLENHFCDVLRLSFRAIGVG
jgi:hypothetical protein